MSPTLSYARPSHWLFFPNILSGRGSAFHNTCRFRTFPLKMPHIESRTYEDALFRIRLLVHPGQSYELRLVAPLYRVSQAMDFHIIFQLRIFVLETLRIQSEKFCVLSLCTTTDLQPFHNLSSVLMLSFCVFSFLPPHYWLLLAVVKERMP